MHLPELIFPKFVERRSLEPDFEDMLRLAYCKHPSVRYCWSRTHDNTLEIAFFHLINKRLDVGLVIKKFYPVLLVLSIGQTKSYVTYLGLTILVAVILVNTALDTFCLLLALISEKYRAYLAILNLDNFLPMPMTGKRRRGSEGDVVGIGGIRRQEINATTEREQSKRKWVDDLDDPFPMDYSSKKFRIWSFHLADLQWIQEDRRAARSKASSAHLYMYPWVPRCPPWYTLRIRKWYAPVGNPRRRVCYSKRQIQGLENFLSDYNPPFNAFCLDDLKDALPCLSPLDTANTSVKIHSALPMPPASQSNHPSGSEDRDDDEDDEVL